MVPGIDPKVDYVFKWLFGVDRNRDLLISLINAVLDWPEDRRIVDVDILNPFNPKETPSDKFCILDIKARDQLGRRYNVEMQMLPSGDLKKRLPYYLAKWHQEQLEEGESYSVIQPTILICLLNGVLFDVPKYHLRFMLRERDLDLVFCDDLTLHLVQLPRFDVSINDVEEAIEKWIWFLRAGESMDAESIPPTLEDPAINKAMKELTVFSQTEMQRERYEARLKAVRDEQSRIEYATRTGLEQGEWTGRIKQCEELLGRPTTDDDELRQLTLDQLRDRKEELEQELQSRLSE